MSDDKQNGEAPKFVFRNEDGSTRIKLRHPITWDGDVHAELTLKPIKAKYLRKLPVADEMEAMIKLTSRLSGLPTQVIDELEREDLVTVMSLVADFMPGGPESGSAP